MSLFKALFTSIISSVLLLTASGFSAHAATACRPPLAPAVPDGATASKDEILAALKVIKNEFQPAIKNFQNCIATEKAAIGDVATPEQTLEWDQLFDAAYALETQVATKMNEAIRAYKARTAGDNGK